MPQDAVKRTTISITAMPCSTPKLIQVRGNMNHEAALTSSAQPAICAQRRQNRASGWPWWLAISWPAPAQSRNRVTMQVRCSVHFGSPSMFWWMKPK